MDCWRTRDTVGRASRPPRAQSRPEQDLCSFVPGFLRGWQEEDTADVREAGGRHLVPDSRGSLFLNCGLAVVRLLSSARRPLFNGSSAHYFLPCGPSSMAPALTTSSPDPFPSIVKVALLFNLWGPHHPMGSFNPTLPSEMGPFTNLSVNAMLCPVSCHIPD